MPGKKPLHSVQWLRVPFLTDDGIMIYDYKEKLEAEEKTLKRTKNVDAIEKLTKYLEGGFELVYSLKFDNDVFNHEHFDCVPTGIRTDGTWVWSERIIYYLRTYGILPDNEAFLAYVKEKDFKIERLSSERETELEEEYYWSVNEE